MSAGNQDILVIPNSEVWVLKSLGMPVGVYLLQGGNPPQDVLEADAISAQMDPTVADHRIRKNKTTAEFGIVHK